MLPSEFTVSPPPLPDRPVVFEQDWRDLAFLHWRVDPDEIRALFPAGTRPDVFDGATYVGLVPFEMRNTRAYGSPPFPYLGDFLETNVRLYSVDDSGRHGVVFLSLESSRLLVSLFARGTVRIPYTWSRQRNDVDGMRRRWVTRRRWPHRGLTSRVIVDVGESIAEPDDLAVFLTARWGLHARWGGRTAWIRNTHPPWQLLRATVVACDDQLVRAAGVAVSGHPDVPTLFSAGLHTRFTAPEFL